MVGIFNVTLQINKSKLTEILQRFKDFFNYQMTKKQSLNRFDLFIYLCM